MSKTASTVSVDAISYRETSMYRSRLELVTLAALVTPAIMTLASTRTRLFGLVAVDPLAFLFDAAFSWLSAGCCARRDA